MLDTWIYCTPAAWAAVAHAGTKQDLYPNELWVKPYRQAITGFWKSWDTIYEVYNTLGSADSIQALVTELGLGVARVYAWEQGPGLDSLDNFQTIPADVLAVMKDHVIYDEDGGIVSTTPPTYENPKWGHLFLGQHERIFAGAVSTGFSRGFL